MRITKDGITPSGHIVPQPGLGELVVIIARHRDGSLCVEWLDPDGNTHLLPTEDDPDVTLNAVIELIHRRKGGRGHQ